MKVGVIGSINMDMVLPSERIPLKGETIKGTEVLYKDGGKGANQAVAIARFGMEVLMFGKVGDDDNGKKLIEHLKENHVDTSYIQVEKNINSGLAVITVADNDNTIIVIPGANNKVDKTYVDSIKEALLSCDFIVMQHEIPLETNEYVVKLCKENRVKTLLNPAPAHEINDFVRDNVDYITPNEHEVKLIFKEQDLNKVLESQKGKLIVTLGSDGVIGYVNGKGIVKVPCRKSKIVDTTGAGDTFNGAFVYALCKEMDIEKALHFANVAAGLSIEKVGAQGGMPTLKEVEDNL